MQTKHPACPKCNGEMTQGFSVESQGPKRMVTGWVEGSPEPALWKGARVPPGKRIPIDMFRCSACGFLESYARGGPAFRTRGPARSNA